MKKSISFLVLITSIGLSPSCLALEKSWTYTTLKITGHKEYLPSITSHSGSATAYIKRHPVKGNTMLYFIVTDNTCKKIGTNHETHFILANNNKELFRSYCLSKNHREMYSESGYLITEEFLNGIKVDIKEIYADKNTKPINEIFSAKGFKTIFYDYNRKTGTR